MLRFVVKGRPRGKGRPRFGGGHAYTDPETRAAEEQIAWSAKAVGAKASTQCARVSITASFKPCKTECAKAKASTIVGPYLKKPDGDNILKLVCDALNGVAWVDDCQVYSASIDKFYGNEDQIEVVIEYL